MKRSFVRPLAFTLLLASAACRDLPEVESNVCGNGVIEQGETCDTFAIDDLECRAPGAPHACHLDCSSDSSAAACIALGKGCDAEGVCRAPTGSFAPPLSLDVSGVSSLSAGDFNGDGRSDLLSQAQPDLFGRAPLQWFYFDRAGELSDSRSFPKPVTPPMLADLTGDRRADLVFNAYAGTAHLHDSAFRIGALLGRVDKTWIPEAYSSYRFPNTPLRMVGVYDGLVGVVQPTSALAAITTPPPPGIPGVYLRDDVSVQLRLAMALDGPVEQLIGDPQTGDIFRSADSPCRELVLAMRDAQEFVVLDLCELQGTHVAFRAQATSARVVLDPPASIDRAPVIADLDGNGQLDVMLGAGGQTYLAYGDGQQLSTAVPYALPSAGPDADPTLAAPLAVGDVTGDGFPDFVLPEFLLLSRRVPNSELPHYEQTYANPHRPWTMAQIVDLNANGHPDVVAASSEAADIDFYNGMGSGDLIHRSIKTEPEGKVLRLGSGDFDGDLINDLAFIQEEAGAAGSHELRIAFGGADVADASPQMIARVRDTAHLAVYREGGLSHMMISSWDGSMGFLTLFYGTPDRIPFAPHTLVSLRQGGDVGGWSSVSILPGKFLSHASGPESSQAIDDGDVLAIGARDDEAGFPGMGAAPADAARALSFWLLEDITQGGQPRRLAQPVPAGFTAVAPSDASLTGNLRPNAAGLAADFDGDGLDEAVWLLPSANLRDCGLFLYTMQGAGDLADLAPRTSIGSLGRPCVDAQIVAADLTGDAARDIVLLTGALSGTERAVHVLRNDGAGNFSLAAQQLVADGSNPEQSSGAIRAFAVLPGATLAIVRERSVELVPLDPTGTIGAAQPLASLQRGTGVAAGDFNGDGVVDLAVADDGNVRVFSASLEAR